MATLPEMNEEIIVERCSYCGVVKHLRCSVCRREVHETVWPDHKHDFFALKHNYDYAYVVCIDCWNKGERWPEPEPVDEIMDESNYNFGLDEEST